MTRYLYTQEVPGDSLTGSGSRAGREAQQKGVLQGQEGGGTDAEGVRLRPGEQLLTAEMKGPRAPILAAEIEGLFAAPHVAAVPFWDTDGPTPADGYYVLRDVETEPWESRVALGNTVDGTLASAGTRRSHFRTARTKLTDELNDYGNDTTARTGISAAATNVRWWGKQPAQVTAAAAVNTQTTEHGAVDLYDPEGAPYEDPVLVYSLPYSEEGKVDCRVWDERGTGLANREDADGFVQWRKVYQPSHEYVGNPVVSNGLLRLVLDEQGGLVAEEYSGGSWSSKALGAAGGWSLLDADLMHISPARVTAQLTFTDGTSTYALDMSLERGSTTARFTTPARNEQGATPPGLVTYLDPVANTSTRATNPEQGLVAREEVRY